MESRRALLARLASVGRFLAYACCIVLSLLGVLFVFASVVGMHGIDDMRSGAEIATIGVLLLFAAFACFLLSQHPADRSHLTTPRALRGVALVGAGTVLAVVLMWIVRV